MPTRRLAAIMFTDIEGYTKLMEEDEAQAQVLRKRHREIFEQSHKQYRGEIIQYFGDGTLSIFDSCVEAVRCAVDMQKAFQEEPQVPLRIGLHLGDIEYSEIDVVGSGVNIASRVESFGISGAVLISGAIKDQIKNHEFEAIPMGTFGMKNVEKPIEVFAIQTTNLELNIPQPKALQGKGKRLDGVIKTRQLIKFASIGFVAMAIGALLFWVSGATGQSQLLPESIREEKVAVSVFDNFTGDKNLDALGYLGSEWISSGLMELNIRTVSPDMVRQNKEMIGILPNNPKGEPSFAEITGAKYVIAGSYFLEGDSIVLNTRLSSTETGEEVQAFPKLKGHKDQKEALIAEARQYLLGYWVLKRDNKLPNINPPKYEAYQAYLGCFVSWYPCHIKVVELDPDFLLARIWVVATSGMWGAEQDFQTSKKFVEKRWNQCTVFEKNLFEYAVARYEGNYQATFDALDRNFRLDSLNYNMLHQSASVASTSLNRTDITIERFEYMFNHLDKYDSRLAGNSLNHYMDALIRQKEYSKAISFYLGLSDPLKQKAGILDYAIALMYEGKIEDIQNLFIQRGNRRDDLLRMAYMYSYIYPDSANNPFSAELASRIEEYDVWPVNTKYVWNSLNTNMWRFWNSQFLTYYILKDWAQAEKALEKLKNYDWDTYYQKVGMLDVESSAYIKQELLWIAAAYGCVYAHQGKETESLAQISKIEQLGKKYNDGTHNPYLRGGTAYLKARIYAVLGEKEKAVEELSKSIEQGKTFIWWTVTFDLDFVNLKGYPPFEALIAPKK